MISLGTMFSVARRSALPSLSLLSAPVTGVRFVSIMSSLSNNPGAYRKKKRLGRGPSSGKGKTSGRGMNGQKQKEKVARWHEGGQTPMHKMLPKFGFNVYQKKKYVKLNLDRVQSWIEQGRLDPSKPITMKHLLDSRACRGIKDGVKLLANVRISVFTCQMQVACADLNVSAPTGKRELQVSYQHHRQRCLKRSCQGRPGPRRKSNLAILQPTEYVPSHTSLSISIPHTNSF
ncbi:ribosomal protein L18e/L15P [Myxozyma melibiosi]|uniref:Ribosomal protein L18e/L15P n=1 Tax=Myxozyma melibiosi TaxID=54550 RepID=A0ABR1FFV9_9ASCO